MRKLIAIILCAVMTLSLAVVGVSAADPEVITTAEQLAAIKVDGNYKLGADIAVASTLFFKDSQGNDTPFTGTLDGAGHTITVSAPVFDYFAGTAKDIIFEGEISATDKDACVASLASWGDGNAKITNVINKANITTGFRGAGIVAQFEAGSDAVITDCVNYGTIKGIGPEGRDELWIGGIIGKQLSGKIHIENCVNYGTVTNDKGFAGGIIGDFGHDKAFDESYICEILNCLNEGSISATTNAGGIVGLTKGCLVKITNCTNKGAVTSSGNDAAGIIGHGGVKSILSRVFVTKCLNEGKITCTGGTIDSNTGLPTKGTNSASGIAGYIYGSGDNGRIEIVDCVNKGEIVATAFASQFMGYTNNVRTVIKNCVGDGKVTGAVKCITGLSSANPLEYNFEGIKLTANDSTDRLSFATSADNAGNIKSIADYTSQEGKADSIIANATYTLDATIGYQAPAAPSDPGTTDPGTTVVTGDTAVIVMIVCAVSLLGMGIALKARRA
jgi:hypothetical protein